MLLNLIHGCLHYLLPFMLGGAVKAAEEEKLLESYLLMTTVFVEQPLAPRGFAYLRPPCVLQSSA